MSQSETFYNLLNHFEECKQHSLIITRENYDKIFHFLNSNEADETIEKTTQNTWKMRLHNYINKHTKLKYFFRFSINVQEQKLYRGEKEVIYRENVFDLLHKTHVEQTGHGGRDAMLHQLKNKFGIGQ